MYRVVGCSDCDALWVVEGRPETTGCPRCGKRHRFEKLKALAEADDEDAARQARAAILAERGGESEAFADLADSLAAAAESDAVDDEEYLRQAGLDPDEVAAAGERAGRGSGGGRSRREVVLDALRELDAPDEERVVAYAGEHGVPADYVRRALEKLQRAGEVAERDGGYRLL